MESPAPTDPLRPAAYVAIKLLLAMLMGLASVLVVFVAGIINGVQMDIGVWTLCGLLAWIGALVFAAFGLFMGYLLPAENVMQILGPILGLLAFFGGLFVPVNLLPRAIQDIAPYMPTYGVAAIARFPLLGGNFDPTWLLSLLGWTVAFAAGATILISILIVPIGARARWDLLNLPSGEPSRTRTGREAPAAPRPCRLAGAWS